MEQVSLKKLFQEGTFNTVSVLRINENEYPYVTLLRKTEKGTASTNLYFGEKTAKIVLSTFQKGDNITGMLADASVIKTENARGETRYKLSINPTSDYASEQSLADVFGVELKNVDFNIDSFIEEFQVLESTTLSAGVGA